VTRSSGGGGQMTIGQALELAVRHHQRGEFPAAEAIYRQVLQVQPTNASAIHLLGVLAHQIGRHDVAVDMIRRAIELLPGDAKFHSNLSEALRALGRPREAVEALNRALALQPNDADFTSNLGVALYESRDVPAAEATLRRAIALNPRIPEPHLHLSRILRDRGQFDQALAEAHRAIELAPNHANMVLNLGLTLLSAGRADEAEAHVRRGLAMDPASAVAHSSLGTLLLKGGQNDQAAQAFSRAVELKPLYAPAHSGLGAALHNLGQHEAAIASFRRALQLAPNDHAAHAGLGLSLVAVGRSEESLQHTRAALELRPDWPEYMNNLAVALEDLGRVDEATEVLQRAARLTPPLAHVENNLAKRLTAAGRIEEALAHFRRGTELAPDDANIYGNMLLAMHYRPEIEPREMFEEHLNWARRFAKPQAEVDASYPNDRSPDRRLRIGYVSPDFAAHSVADFLEPILERHDHQHFEIHCYADVHRPDPYTRRLRQHADVWTDIAHVKDDRVAEIIRGHQIDILVDLAGHTARNRMPVFALRPAPVQVTYLGYPDTTGQSAIAWRITDAIADPPGMTEAFHTETLLRLPRTFLCYRPFPDAPAVGPLPADQRDHITFASFNALPKVTPRVVELWSRVLAAVPGSRLLIKAAGLDASPRDRLREQFRAHGIADDRVEMVGRIPDLAEHFGLYNRVDIALDTFPYHGTTTTCEALWMGVPVVTVVGQIHMARVGLSLLSQVRLDELATPDAEQYVATAAALAADRARLRDLRAGLRERFKASPLLDGAGVTRELESAYRDIWARWVQSS
jgi:predicted O-linked N-acetylglucosamine transferase (SPINDLY family)